METVVENACDVMFKMFEMCTIIFRISCIILKYFNYKCTARKNSKKQGIFFLSLYDNYCLIRVTEISYSVQGFFNIHGIFKSIEVF
jgi:hypothetical protein